MYVHMPASCIVQLYDACYIACGAPHCTDTQLCGSPTNVHLQWNLSIADTIVTELAVLYREGSLIQR